MRSGAVPHYARPIAAWLLAAPVMALLALAGAGKLLSLASFRQNLGTWQFLPIWSLDHVAWFVPSAELLVGAAWLLGLLPRLTERIGLCMIFVFTMLYVTHWIVLSPPDCVCFGQWAVFRGSIDNAQLVVVRNSSLFCLLATSIHLRRSHQKHVTPSSTLTNGSSASTALSRPGFSLTEVLVCIVVIGIVISITVPLLMQTKNRAKQLKTISMLGQHAKSFQSYAGQYNDVWPYIANPSGSTVFRTPDFSFETKYFDSSTHWHLALSSELYDVPWNDRIFQTRSWTNGVWTPFWYAPTFIARSEFWNQSTRTGSDQWKPTTVSSVRYPSSKSLFVGPRDPDPSQGGVMLRWQSSGWLMSFTDGSGARVSDEQLLPGVPSGVGSSENGSDWLHFSHPGMVTVDGVRGRDRR